MPTTQPAVATSTRTGGAVGSNVKPPSTGTGSASTNYAPWLISMGALLLAIGGGSVLVGTRRRS